MNISDRGNAAQLITMLERSGAKPPAAVAESYATTTRVSKQVREIGVRPETIYAPITAALTRGDDPTTDPEVTRILVSGMLANAGVTAGVDEIAFTAFRDVCTAHADAIITAFRKPFDQAAATLATAHKSIGNVPLADSDSVLRIGGAAAAQWAKAQAAVVTIAAVMNGWAALAAFGRLATPDPRHMVLRLAAVDYQTWTTQELEGSRADAWSLLIAGHDLALPTYTEYAERVDAIHRGAERAAAQQAYDTQAYMTGRPPAVRA